MGNMMICSVCGKSPKFRGDFYEIMTAEGQTIYVCSACARGEKDNAQNTLGADSANTQNTLGKRCNALGDNGE